MRSKQEFITDLKKLNTEIPDDSDALHMPNLTIYETENGIEMRMDDGDETTSMLAEINLDNYAVRVTKLRLKNWEEHLPETWHDPISFITYEDFFAEVEAWSKVYEVKAEEAYSFQTESDEDNYFEDLD